MVSQKYYFATVELFILTIPLSHFRHIKHRISNLKCTNSTCRLITSNKLPSNEGAGLKKKDNPEFSTTSIVLSE